MFRKKNGYLALLIFGALFLLGGIILSVSGARSVEAKYLPAGKLDEDKLDFYSANSILFYDGSCVIPTAGGGIWKGNTFDLSDGQLYGLLHVAIAEEGSTIDALKFELSIMANLFEYWGGSDLYSYVCGSGWFSTGSLCYNTSRGSLTDEQIEAAKDVLLNGNRVIPPQIVEHDCICDLSHIETEGRTYYRNSAEFRDMSNWVSGKTVVYQDCGRIPTCTSWVFYTFPPGTERVGDIDPYGYYAGNPPDAAAINSSTNGGSSVVTVGDIDSVEMTLIGDSVAVRSESELRNKFKSGFFTMNTSRHPSAGGSGAYSCSGDEGGVAILNKMLNGSGTVVVQHSSGSCDNVAVDENSLRDVVVWELGANPVGADRSTMEAVISMVGDRKLFLVTPYDNNLESINDVADLYRSLAEEHDNVYVVDWNEKVKGTGSTYLTDGVHPNSAGAQLLADLIEEAILESYSCMPAVDSSEYQERLSNLHNFNQHTGDFSGKSMCSGGGSTVSGGGCGLMSLMAAYYMFTGNGLGDTAVYNELSSAAQKDGYNQCSYSNFYAYGDALEEYTGMTGERIYSDDYAAYSDKYWDDFVEALKAGKKILIGTDGADSKFAVNAHALLLDHYDEEKDAIWLFDPDMDPTRASYSGISYSGGCTDTAYASVGGCQDGVYVSRSAMANYVKPRHAYTLTYYDDCYDVCVTGGKIEGGLDEEQAQKLADYYNSSNVDGYVTYNGIRTEKNNCTYFSYWFLRDLTDLDNVGGLGNGGDVAHNLALRHNLEEGNEPRPFAIFSSVADGVAYAINPSTGLKYGHTGVVVAVNGDEVLTVEAGWPTTAGHVATYNVDHLCRSNYSTCFTYLDSHVNETELSRIVGGTW